MAFRVEGPSFHFPHMNLFFFYRIWIFGYQIEKGQKPLESREKSSVTVWSFSTKIWTFVEWFVLNSALKKLYQAQICSENIQSLIIILIPFRGHEWNISLNGRITACKRKQIYFRFGCEFQFVFSSIHYFHKLLYGGWTFTMWALSTQRTNLSNTYIKLLASGFIQPHNFPEFIKFWSIEIYLFRWKIRCLIGVSRF